MCIRDRSCYIRQYQIDDVEDIYQLNKEEMGYDYPIELTAKKIMALCQSSCDRIFVAEESGKVIGYVHANNYDTLYFGHMKNIMGIAVSSLHKRHGIGSLLLAEVEKDVYKRQPQDDEEVIEVKKNIVDLTPVIFQEIMLEVPMRVVRCV